MPRQTFRLGARKFALAVAALALSCAAHTLSSSGSLATEAPGRREDELKAAYLLNFTKFVEWPAQPSHDSLTICFNGGVGVYRSLATGPPDQRVAARRLHVRLLSANEGVEGCNVLFVGSGAASTNGTALEDAPALLTVGDAKDFAQSGGMIELFTESNRLRFNINLENARRAGVQIGSSLLQLAAAVDKRASK